MNKPITASDEVQRFVFEPHAVRGHWVQIEDAWRELRIHTRYPAPIERLLGEALSAAVLLAATLKFRGTLTFQLQSSGPLRLLVAQCTHDFKVRAVARCDEPAMAALGGDAGLPVLAGPDARITVTIEADERNTRYQGIVPLAGDSLAQCLEAYFAGSEQLPTRVVLASDATRAAGLLIQKLPGAGEGEDTPDAQAWAEAQLAIGTVTPAQLLRSRAQPLLSQTFPGQDLRLFTGSAVAFECRCNPQRVAGVLRALGAGEIRDVLREQGAVTVTCEFCQRPFRYDAIDIEALFTEGPEPGATPAVH
ncbi:MAG: Hsp33 family molecular chaperone HslO [Proteobacteria bacterium]|nr:Hsp33 family molecular chaperone HslO [Pseudomonadota bacterium]